MKTKTNTNYVWMLKNKTTGEIYPTYTYATRASARKATRSTSGRFTNFTPVKVFETAKTKTVKRTMTKGQPTGAIQTASKFSGSSYGAGGFPIYAR